MNDFWGREFDWFAPDTAGNLGVFCFAGHGFIPEQVLAHHEEHTLLAAEIPLPHFGSLKVWHDYARYGLFVYDWNIYDGPYRQEAKPSKPLREDVEARILQIEGLPILRYNFHDKSTISIADLAP